MLLVELHGVGAAQSPVKELAFDGRIGGDVEFLSAHGQSPAGGQMEEAGADSPAPKLP